MRVWNYGLAVGLLAGLGACSHMMDSSRNNQAPAPPPAAMASPVVAPDMIRQVQATLQTDGYYKHRPVDGVYGRGTETAVRSFQKDHNLSSSGELDAPTLQALNLPNGSAAANNTATAQPSPPATQPMASSSTPPPANTAAAPAAH
jgi:peptidoglycan hydrolase-like protein with peptidoglycan-binding domain